MRKLKTLRRAMLSVSTVALSLPFSAGFAAEIEEIIITSAHIEETIPQDLARYGNRVELITSEELEQHGFIDVAQALQMLVPGLHVRPKNGQFDYMDVSLHGSRNAELLILIDGVRITNRLYNGTSPLDTIPAHMVERIEVLKGGQGIFYGTQSVGGVINVVTKSFSAETEGAIGAGVNSNDGYNLHGYVRGGNEQHQFVLFASKDEADGYQPYSDEDFQASATDRERGYDVNTGGLKYAFNINQDLALSLQYQRTENNLDYARPYLTVAEYNEREEDIVTLKLDWQLNDNVGLFVKAYQHNWDTQYSRIYNTLDGAGEITGALDVRDDKTYWGYEDRGANAMVKFNFNNGFEYVLGLDHQKFSGTDDVWRIGDQEESVNAVFGQVRTTQQLLENTALAFGLRHNKASNVESSTVWNFSGKHQLTDSLYVRTNIGTSFRLPDAEALFLREYDDVDNDGVPDGGWFALGNPDLKPEQSRNINLALGGSSGNFSYEVVAFKREISDYIDSYVSVFIGGVEGESFINSSDEVEVDGFEITASYAFNEAWQANISYNDTNSELNGDGIQLTGIPESEVKLRVDYSAQALPLGLSLTLNHVGEFNARRGEVRGNYTVMDLSAHYAFGVEQEHLLSLRLENLTDKEYATRVGRGALDGSGSSYLFDNLGMSRTVHAGYSYRF